MGALSDAQLATLRRGLTESVKRQLDKFQQQLDAACNPNEEDRIKTRAAELWERLFVAAGVAEELSVVADHDLQSSEVNDLLEQITDDMLERLGNDVRSKLSDSEGCLKEVRKLVQEANRAERASMKDGRTIGKTCQKTTYIHLVTEGPVKDTARKRMWSIDGRSYDAVRRVRGSDLFIAPYLPVSDHPAVHYILSLNVIQTIPRLRFLLDRIDPAAPLSTTELTLLDVEQLSSKQESSAIVAVRVDAERVVGSAGIMARGRENVKRSLAARRGMTRGAERSASGTAVGVGWRPDLQGKIGPYANFRSKRNGFKTTLSLVSSERRSTDLVVGVADVVVPGFTAELRRNTAETGMPPTSRSGIAAQALSMLNWDALTHIEPASDPTLTGAVSFGSEAGDDGPEADFGFPTINGDKGLVLQSGYSTFFFFSARLYLHGTSHLASLDQSASLPLASRTLSSDVADLIVNGVLAIEPEEQAPECQRVTVSMESQTLEMTPARLKALANIPTLSGTPPALPPSSSLNREQVAPGYGFCFFPKERTFNFQRQRAFDLEAAAAKAPGIGAGRYHYKARLPKTSSASPSSGAGPLGRIVPESGDAGQAGSSATVAIPTSDLSSTLAQLTLLSDGDHAAVTEELDNAFNTDTAPRSSKRKRT